MLVRLNIWFSSEMGLLSWLFCFLLGWGSLFHPLRLGPLRNIDGLLDFVVYYPKSLIGLIVGHLFSNLVLCKYELFLRKPVPWGMKEITWTMNLDPLRKRYKLKPNMWYNRNKDQFVMEIIWATSPIHWVEKCG